MRAIASAPPALKPPRAILLLRFAGNLVLTLVGVFCTLMLALRFVVFPLVESHRGDISAFIASRIGLPVEIDAIATGWDGWNPKLSIRGFRIRDASAEGAVPLLELPRVDLIVAWTSLTLADLRLREMIVEGPMLAVQRDPQGRIRIAGFSIDPERTSHRLTDWLLRQRQIVVRDALITWNDELRRAPQLVLDQVQFRLEKTFGRHRFGLTGTPPVELAAPIDLRGEVADLEASDWRAIDGRFYVRLDYADVSAWGEWLPLPLPIDSGVGALRLWVELDQGQPRDVLADLELADVRARLGSDLPPLGLQHVQGRIGWKRDREHQEIHTRALQFHASDGTVLPPTDFAFAHDDAAAGREARGSLSFARLDLAPLTALAGHLPLPESMRRDLARFAPRGVLIDGRYAWEGPAGAPVRFAASGAFDRLGVNAQDLFPGATGVSGSFEAHDTHGLLKLESRAMALDLPRVFVEPVVFDTAAGSVRWERGAEALRVSVDALAFANAHAAGTASGTWRSMPTGPGFADLRAQLTRASVEHLYRYVPHRISANVREWLRSALQKGTSKDVRMALTGNLAEFPFPSNRSGHLLVTVKGQGGTLAYAPNWPPISEIDADVRFEGSKLTVDATSGKTLGAHIGRTRAEIADLQDPGSILRLTGEASGPVTEFLAFVAQTPVAGWTDHVAEKMKATGSGRLALSFDLPLRAPGNAKVDGQFHFTDARVDIAQFPPLTQASGRLEFDHQSLRGTDITGQFFGGPVKLQLSAGDGRLQADARGAVSVAQLRPHWDSPLVERMSGSTDWHAVVNARAQAVSWTIESTLKGAAIELPAPLGKPADASTALRIERREPPASRRDELVTVDYGDAARVLLRRPQGGSAAFDRALVLLGRSAERPGDADRNGLWIRADVATLSLDDWLAVGRSVSTHGRTGGAAPTSAMELEGADIAASTLLGIGRTFHDMKLSARRAGDDWRVSLDAREAVGTAVWQGPTPATPNGRAVVRLARLSTAAGDGSDANGGGSEAARRHATASAWPELDLSADGLYAKGRDLGKLQVTARPSGPDWQIQSFVLANDAGSIKAGGWWRTAPPQTRLDVAIETPEAGAFLGRLGLADAIKGAPTTIDGELAWPGSPGDFDFKALSGAFRVKSEAGQFLKADPGMGRLLGVLSLQALPRRITLDFRDVFSEGFAFDSIDGNVKIGSGIMSAADLRMVGPSASVDISGDVDLSRETQRLRVRVQPSLSTSISAGAAALFIANPLVGAAVGAGALLAQKVLKDPLDQLFSYEYSVSGGWSDPIVERLASRSVALPSSPAK